MGAALACGDGTGPKEELQVTASPDTVRVFGTGASGLDVRLHNRFAYAVWISWCNTVVQAENASGVWQTVTPKLINCYPDTLQPDEQSSRANTLGKVPPGRYRFAYMYVAAPTDGTNPEVSSYRYSYSNPVVVIP